ncbi:MAG: CE1 family esterase [Planctomycetota bacterium]|jgi:polyhydroxybutyrate depolymerase
MIRSSRLYLPALALLIAGCRAWPGNRALSKSDPGVLVIDGKERTYLLYEPPRLHRAAKAPLVICLHGGGGDGHSMELLTRYGFNVLADIEGFLVVYPDGIRRRWRDGREAEDGIDDVGFLSALIDALVESHNVDPHRVFVTGMSNGAMMSFRLAADLPRKIAGAAPVGASMPAVLKKGGRARRPVPILIIGGVEDPIVPWEGGEIRVLWKSRGRVLSMKETAAFWAENNGCEPHPETALLDDLDPEDCTRVRRDVWRGGEAPVVLLAVEGGGHTWPGGWQYLGRWLVGRTSRDLDACWEIWGFFRHWCSPSKAKER